MALYSIIFVGLRGRGVFNCNFFFSFPSGFVSQSIKLTISLKRQFFFLNFFLNLQNSGESELAIITTNGHNSRHFTGGTLRELSFTSPSNALAVPVLVIILIGFSE